MDKDRIRAYLHSLSRDHEGQLLEMRAFAERERIPIIRRETESLLRTMVTAIDPDCILEIGTAIGYSAIVMAECCGAKVTTIENYERRGKAAFRAFRRVWIYLS